MKPEPAMVTDLPLEIRAVIASGRPSDYTPTSLFVDIELRCGLSNQSSWELVFMGSISSYET